MQHYGDTARSGTANGFTSTQPTPSPSSTLLRDKYGIANPMAPEDGHDDEAALIAQMNEWRHS